ncbi:unknown [Neodiprion lecontei nucleopolyhedrovirus]|uniref:Uncharacterized protein n=1 Tax=Neodiprion lecontei nucleopolyhedrovirus (strain Canada) TaxID=654906 RepID=Q6JPC0_NPVNC|nr:unknown [Neodiprion lecontei nucleopolyhedrovirus]AAQ99104.1 unknown [Neodiprion lecontei nucleopolyhedrovirus]
MSEIYTDPVSVFYQYVSRNAEMSLNINIKQITLSDIGEDLLPGVLADLYEDDFDMRQLQRSDSVFQCTLKYRNVETIGFSKKKRKARDNACFDMAIYLKILKPSDALPACVFQILKEYIKQQCKPQITWSRDSNLSYRCDMIYDSKHVFAEGKSKKNAKEAVCISMLNLIVNGDNYCN